jgi:hypothetical protein
LEPRRASLITNEGLAHPREDATDASSCGRPTGNSTDGRSTRYADGTYFIGIEPGDFICYYTPWDGHDYDT